MTEAVQVIGAIAATLTVSTAMLAQQRRTRAIALLAGIVIASALILGEAWDELESLRDPLPLFVVACLLAASALIAVAVALHRWPLALPVLVIAALPFRVPIDVSGEDANLLLPLYTVIGAGALAFAIDAFRHGGERRGSEPRVLLIALAAGIVLYAIQAAYSSDVGFAIRNVGFFLVPFGVMFVLLSEIRWTPRVLAVALAVVIGEALLFALVGIGQAIAGEIFWNPALERSNDFHFYFRVNSLFWDPNIYGRYLALAAVLVTAVLMWTRDPRRIWTLAGILLVLLVGLLFGFSQTSFIALLFGIAVLCALRWSARWTAIAVPVAALVVVAAVIVLGGTSESENSAREISSGRTTLIEGGADLVREEPMIGHGSASFSKAFAEQEGISESNTTVSHNEPITVAAEQGVVGVIAYLALIGIAYWTLLGGMRRIAPGLGAPEDAIGDPAQGGAATLPLARIALVAAFTALLVHTIGYAGYLTDPFTWALLAIGGSLATAGSSEIRRTSSASRPGVLAPGPADPDSATS